MHLQRDRQPARALIAFVEQIRQRARIVGRALECRAAERRERLHRHDPRRDRGGEALGEKRPERLVLPSLDVARRPVVEQHYAEDMTSRLVYGHRAAQRIPTADDEAELDLVVEPRARPEARRFLIRRLDLPARPAYRRAGDHDRRGAAVVADRQPLVIRQQGIVRAEQLADAHRVVDAGVEVGVVADLAGQSHLDFALRHEASRPRCFSFATDAQSLDQLASHAAPRSRAARHERVHALVEAQLEDPLADRDADAPGVPAAAAEAPIGQVLEREVARRVVGGLDPARHQLLFSTPRRIWSSSIDSNSALKLPSPKPSSPLRWMNSKKMGPSWFSLKICSSSAPFLPSTRILRFFRSATLSPWPGMRLSTSS